MEDQDYADHISRKPYCRQWVKYQMIVYRNVMKTTSF